MHQSARLVGSVVLCWSPLTSHVLGVYFSMVEVRKTQAGLVLLGLGVIFQKESAYTDGATSDWTSSPVHPLLSRSFLQFSRQPNICAVHRTL